MRKSGWMFCSKVGVHGDCDGDSGWRCDDDAGPGPGQTRLSREAGILSLRRLGMLLILFRRRGCVSRYVWGKVDSVGVWDWDCGVIVEFEDVVSKESGRTFPFLSIGDVAVVVDVVLLLVVG